MGSHINNCLLSECLKSSYVAILIKEKNIDTCCVHNNAMINLHDLPVPSDFSRDAYERSATMTDSSSTGTLSSDSQPHDEKDVPQSQMEAPPAEHQNFESYVIDADGDVWMQLSGGRLLVSRKVLCLSSKVYSAMFESKFSESTQPSLADDGIQQVVFPDDDYESMRLIAHITHFQTDLVPRSLSIKQFAKIAVLCDKYELRHCLSLFAGLWTEPLPILPCAEMPDLLLIATVFRQDERFNALTRALIQNTTYEPQTDHILIANEAFSDVIPEGIIGKFYGALLHS